MNGDLMDLFNFFLSFILLIFSSIIFYKKIVIRDYIFIFWGGVIYFSILPIFIDSYLMFFGGLNELNLMVIKDTENYWDGVNREILFSSNLFILLFLIIFFCFDLLFKNIFKGNKIEVYKYNRVQILILIFLAYLPAFLLFKEGFNFIENQKQGLEISKFAKNSYVLMPIGAVVAYNFFISKKYFLAWFFCLPIIFISILSQSRTLFILVPVVLVMSYLYSAKRINIKKIFIYVLIILSLSQVVKAFTNNDYGIFYTDNKLLFLTNKMIRDVSIGDSYYSFYIRNIDPDLTTQGSSTLALISTGIIPPFINRDLFVPEKTATYKIYQLRYGEYSFGSLHPTLIGYAYFDLGFMGVLLSIFLTFMMRFYSFLMSKFVFSQAIAPVLLGGFIFVCLRGSVNVAYFNLFYSGLLIFVIMGFVHYVFKSNLVGGNK